VLCGIGQEGFGGEVHAQCGGERVAVGKVNEAEADEAHEHIARVEARAEACGFLARFENAGQVGKNRALRHRTIQLFKVASFIEILPQQKPDKAGVFLEK